jgi:hypothetical protein
MLLVGYPTRLRASMRDSVAAHGRGALPETPRARTNFLRADDLIARAVMIDRIR